MRRMTPRATGSSRAGSPRAGRDRRRCGPAARRSGRRPPAPGRPRIRATGRTTRMRINHQSMRPMASTPASDQARATATSDDPPWKTSPGGWRPWSPRAVFASAVAGAAVRAVEQRPVEQQPVAALHGEGHGFARSRSRAALSGVSVPLVKASRPASLSTSTPATPEWPRKSRLGRADVGAPFLHDALDAAGDDLGGRFGLLPGHGNQALAHQAQHAETDGDDARPEGAGWRAAEP